MNHRNQGILVPALALALCAFASIGSGAESRNANDLIVIVNPASKFELMSAREIRSLFLGKSRQLPDGSRAVLAAYEPVESDFYRQALNRSTAQVDAAWSRLRFSGRTMPPKAFNNTKDLIAFVANTPNAIAFVSGQGINDTAVREVFRVP